MIDSTTLCNSLGKGEAVSSILTGGTIFLIDIYEHSRCCQRVYIPADSGTFPEQPTKTGAKWGQTVPRLFVPRRPFALEIPELSAQSAAPLSAQSIPQTETEAGIVRKLEDGSRELSIKRGVFYECRGGWVRHESRGPYNLPRSEDDSSVMIVLRPAPSDSAPGGTDET